MTADEIISILDLAPHPEGGWYRQTWIDDVAEGRPTGTAIYFLLKAGEVSHWHKVDATGIWHFHAGAPLILSSSAGADGRAQKQVLGGDLSAGERPQVIIPKGHWQSARTTGGWALVSCTVSPGFRFEGFELAPPDFNIPGEDFKSQPAS